MGINIHGLSESAAAYASIEKVKNILSDSGISGKLHSWKIQESDFLKIIQEYPGDDFTNKSANVSKKNLYNIS